MKIREQCSTGEPARSMSPHATSRVLQMSAVQERRQHAAAIMKTAHFNPQLIPPARHEVRTLRRRADASPPPLA